MKTLTDFIQELKDNGFTVFTSDKKDPVTYCHFSKNNQIGYVQGEYFGGFNFSTVHKPCREYGTGFRVTPNDGISEPTIEWANKAFAFSGWVVGDPQNIKKYNSVDEYIKRETILEQRFL